MSIVWLIVISGAAGGLVIARFLIRFVVWQLEVVEAKHRYRHARRRRNRATGYIPIYDNEWRP
jgi:hypothetical protein